MDEFERVVCVKNEVFVFRIPPRASNRGHRAADWTLDKPDWTGRLRVVTLGTQLTIKLEDKTSGELFAQAPVEAYPGIAVEPVTDSSRYFVLQIKDPSGRTAFIGIGFTDRGDSFDLNVTLQDHFKRMKQEEEIEQQNKEFLSGGPKLDLGFKEGQTISINFGNKQSGGERRRPRPAATGGAGGLAPLLPPPPGGAKIGRPQAVVTPQPAAQPTAQPAANTTNSTPAAGLDLLGGSLSSNSAPPAQPPTQPASAASGASNVDLLMDLDPFASSGNPQQSTSQPSGGWQQF